MSNISENLKNVKLCMELACLRSGRRMDEVTLVAVSKTKPVSMVREVMAAGVKDFGENKVQELCTKAEEIEDALNWHLIGHLQRNKVKSVIDKAYLIHSLDSLRLAREINKEAGKLDIICPVLAEINIAGEESKFGIREEEAAAFIEEAAKLSHIKIKGLMCVAPFVDEAEENRPHFKRMRLLKEKLAAMNIEGVEMKELSMGMTGDFEVAIEEGATIIRVGTAIFGHRDYSSMRMQNR